MAVLMLVAAVGYIAMRLGRSFGVSFGPGPSAGAGKIAGKKCSGCS